MKKILFLFLIFFCSFSLAESITNIAVPPTAGIGDKITVTGLYSQPNTLCKFTINDSNSITIDRLSDQYTFSDGSFYAETTIREPEYNYGGDYNATITCDLTTETSAIFHITEDYNVSINEGAESSTSTIVNLLLRFPTTTTNMAFSCDNSNWSGWETAAANKYNFDLIRQSSIGCVSHGLGIYYVYAAFSDGTVHIAKDTIVLNPEATTEKYTAPDEPSSTTVNSFTIMGLDNIGLGVIAIAAILIILGLFLWSKRAK